MNALLVALLFRLTSALLQPLTCDLAPDGWAALKYLWQRDDHYHGVALTVTSDLTFWKRGAAYLRTLYEGGTLDSGQVIPAGSIDAVAVLNVYDIDPNTYLERLIKRLRVDFTTYRSLQRGGVQVKLKELGLPSNLLTRADIEQDVFSGTSLGGAAIPAPAPQTILLHSQALRLKYAAKNQARHELTTGYIYGNSEDLSHEQLLYFGFDTTDQNDLQLGAAAGGFVAGDASTVVPIYTAKEMGPFTIEYNLAWHLKASNNGQGPEFETVEGDAYLRIAYARGGGATYRLIPDFYAGGLAGDYEVDSATGAQTVTANLSIGDTISLYARYFVHDFGGVNPGGIRTRSTIDAAMQAGSYLRITADSTTPTSLCRGLLVHEALRRLTEGMADEANCFYSDYFGRTDSQPAYAVDGPGSRRLLTDGFRLRGFPLLQDYVQLGPGESDLRKAFTLAFAGTFDSLNATDCLGAGFELRDGRATLRVEPRAYFYQAAETLRLGEVSDLAKSPYLPAYFNQAQVGYQHWQSDAATGLDEFNGQRTYSTTLTLKAVYSALSTLNAAGQLLEAVRRERYENGSNQGGQADQEGFVICLRRDAAGQLVTEKSEAFTTVTGILSPNTTYNLRLSPARNLRRHGAFLRAGLVPQAAQGGRLALGKVEGNDKLVTLLTGETTPVDEHADVLLTELASPAYVGEVYDFTARLRRHQVRQLAAKPYGRISFLENGQRKQGYLLKCECEPASGKATFTLLRVV